ncbi:MAG: hypothetical protein GY750_05120 [Lentisphaerae bacterium]|nr:hypothetical protein [Lentisphaerota bacterium]MCP4100794.1 hypothetical protein [Lentisphaerota bacterium]
MTNKLPFFKFDCDDWLTGKIQLCDMETQGIFTNLCAMMWRENGKIKKDRFLHKKIRVPLATLEGALVTLKELEIIYENDEYLSAKFIDDQIKDGFEYVEQCRTWGRLGAEKRKGTPAYKKRREEIRKEKNTKKRSFDFQVTPTLEKSKLSDETQLKFIDWLEVYHAIHGKMHPTAQNLQIKALLAIPDSRREKALDESIRSQWKNIHDPSQQPQHHLASSMSQVTTDGDYSGQYQQGEME